MADNCYMTLKCRACDEHIFDALGFSIQKTLDNRPGIIEMDQQEGSPRIFLDAGTPGRMPLSIPYLARHHEGGECGPYIFACDGMSFVEADANFAATVPVVRWDIDKNEVIANDVTQAMQYTKVAKEVERIFEGYSAAYKSPAAFQRGDAAGV